MSLDEIQSWVTLPVGNEAAMMLAVATIGPLAAAVDASALSFQVFAPAAPAGLQSCKAMCCSDNTVV